MEDIKKLIQDCCNDLGNKVNDVNRKLDFNAPVFSGSCDAPTKTGDWYSYNRLSTNYSNNFTSVFQSLSTQLEQVHKDVCKAVQPKLDFPELPLPYECKDGEIVPVSSEDVPWLNDLEGQFILPYAIEQLIKRHFDLTVEVEKKTLEVVCDLDTGNSVLLPDPMAIHTNAGKYLIFHWVLEENPSTKVYKTQTQLAEPIPELYTGNLENNWQMYFSNLYRIVGNQFTKFFVDELKYEITSGWFISIDEGRRYWEDIKKLTSYTSREKSNPVFTNSDNQNIFIQNVNKKLIVHKVLIADKTANTDECKVLVEYKRPKNNG